MSKNLIRKRREKGAVCPKCKSPDYNAFAPDLPNGKPSFVCYSCKNSWQFGYDGGVYMELADNEAIKTV